MKTVALEAPPRETGWTADRIQRPQYPLAVCALPVLVRVCGGRGAWAGKEYSGRTVFNE